MTTNNIKHPPTEGTYLRLPLWARFYFYGMHGLLDEIVFTALFDLLLEPGGNWHLKGCTTITIFFIYGSGTIIMEQFFLFCVRRGYSLAYRLPFYVLAVYVVEFTWGLALRQVGACSWDYSHYPLNLMGLITLVYAPFWTARVLYQDFVYTYLSSLYVCNGDLKEKLA